MSESKFEKKLLQSLRDFKDLTKKFQESPKETTLEEVVKKSGKFKIRKVKK